VRTAGLTRSPSWDVEVTNQLDVLEASCDILTLVAKLAS
jgi:hypothetical protein